MNNLKPFVSVCIQTYQHINYIKQCLDSILMQQTTFPFEIILGEDESNDGTREICIDYANKNPDKIKLFLRSRKDVIYINGQATGRYNFIENLKACQGKYVAICEGDDYWTDPLKLQKQVDFLETNKHFAGSFHDTMMIDEMHANPKLKPWRIYDKDVFEQEDTISTLALFHTSSFMFRNDAIEFPNWLNKVQSADMALFALIASKGALYRIDDFMSVYRKNETSITNFVTSKKYHKNRIKLQSYLRESLSEDTHDKIKKVIVYHTSELIKIRTEPISRIVDFLKRIKFKLNKIIKII